MKIACRAISGVTVALGWWLMAAGLSAGEAQPGSLTSAEVSARMAEIAGRFPQLATVEKFGISAGGRPLEVLRIGDFALPPENPQRPLTFLLVGTQHGMEPSGGEALLRLAAELVAEGKTGQRLNGARYLLVPNLNPDGRDRNRRVNGAKVNLSTDFTLLTQPESQALVRLLEYWGPDVVLDLHESAIWKKQSLGAQGYLLDFEAQFEVANHPGIAPPLRDLAPAHCAELTRGHLLVKHKMRPVTDFYQRPAIGKRKSRCIALFC